MPSDPLTACHTSLTSDRSSSLDPEEKSDENQAHDPENAGNRQSGRVRRRNQSSASTAEYGLKLRQRHQRSTQEWLDWIKARAQAATPHYSPTATKPTVEQKIADCGKDAWVQYSKSTGKYRVAGSRCHHRACPHCRLAWSFKLRSRIADAAKRLPATRAKLVTLTMRSTSCPLVEQVTNLWSAFRKLRQRTFWKALVEGCIAVLEVTYNDKTCQWHPHLHLVCSSTFIDQQKLSSEWLKCTKSSMIVDVRAIRDVSDVAKYLTNYLTKTMSLPRHNQSKLFEELLDLYSKQRVHRAYGSLYLNEAAECDEEPYPSDWEPIAPYHQIVEQAAAGDPAAIQILTALRKHPDDPVLVEIRPPT
jgi:hypothetical protein